MVAPTPTAQQDAAGSSARSDGGEARQLAPAPIPTRIAIDWGQLRGAAAMMARLSRTLVTLAIVVGFPALDLSSSVHFLVCI